MQAGTEPEAAGFKYNTVLFLVYVFAAVHSNPFQFLLNTLKFKKARLHSEEWWNVNRVHLLKYKFTSTLRQFLLHYIYLVISFDSDK